ncbi:MAG: PQQ-dependent sugar dehydrogenase, partial [Bacteroidales bacterium]|nr:PQQ-dependent sugar dehydrogenase [Bacteroidales bacterium]
LALFVYFGCTGSQHPPIEVPNIESTHKIRIEVLAEGLENPWSMAFLPDGRILLAERPGKLRIFENGQLSKESVSGLPVIWAHGQGGLLDVVLHPDYENNGWIYLAYSTNEGAIGSTAIARAKLEGNNLVQLEELFRGDPFTELQYHFGCRIVFENENTFYFTIGDRGVMNNAQTLANHNGKVMRLHADGSIPADNPYVGVEGAKAEIWNYGHRNIQGMALHPVTKELWTHEHGPKGGDEINIEQKGANYGWPKATFGINYNGTIITTDTTLPGITDPIHYWVPSIAPCGMDFVTSDIYPNWKNNLLVGALAGRQIQRLVFDGSKVVYTEKLLEEFARFRDIRQGPDGYIYVLTEGPGLFFKLVPEK